MENTYPICFVYKLHSQSNECFYIGSTVLSLQKRKNAHLNNKRTNERFIKWISTTGKENIEITPINEYQNITKRQLREYEDAEIKKHLYSDRNCLNNNRSNMLYGVPFNDKKQYNREYMRKLRAEPEYERGDLYDLCPICKCTYWLSNWSRHQKTKKHQQLDSPPTEEALLIRNKSGATPF